MAILDISYMYYRYRNMYICIVSALKSDNITTYDVTESNQSIETSL